jgi:hypothetical protein
MIGSCSIKRLAKRYWLISRRNKESWKADGMEEERIRELEEKERALMVQSIEGARAPAVSPALRREIEEVRAELKAARRVATMKANRTEPVKDVGIRINIDAAEYRRLSDNAAAAAMTLNNYIRDLLKIHG